MKKYVKTKKTLKTQGDNSKSRHFKDLWLPEKRPKNPGLLEIEIIRFEKPLKSDCIMQLPAKVWSADFVVARNCVQSSIDEFNKNCRRILCHMVCQLFCDGSSIDCCWLCFFVNIFHPSPLLCTPPPQPNVVVHKRWEVDCYYTITESSLLLSRTSTIWEVSSKFWVKSASEPDSQVVHKDITWQWM